MLLQVAPWSKTGGLGDVLGSLPIALAARGHRVMVVTPRYGNYAEPENTGVSCSSIKGCLSCVASSVLRMLYVTCCDMCPTCSAYLLTSIFWP